MTDRRSGVLKLLCALPWLLMAGACSNSDGVVTPADDANPSILNHVSEQVLRVTQVSALSTGARAKLAEVERAEWARVAYAAELLVGPEVVAASDRIRLELSPNEVLESHRHVVSESVQSEGAVTWAGGLQEAEDQTGLLSFALVSDNLYGNASLGNLSFLIKPLGDGWHAIVEIDPRGFSSELPPLRSSRAEGVREGALESSLLLTTAEIDVLVVYTNAVTTAEGGHAAVAALANQAVNAANQSYTNSNIDVDLNLAHLANVSYAEALYSWQDHIDHLRDPNSGQLDGVADLRDEYLADLVVLLVDDSGACGIAYEVLASAPTAVSAVDSDCAVANYTFAHELGHLQGADHDPDYDCTEQGYSCGPYSYGRGYIAADDSWRTVMAYGDECGMCTRVNYWSNPNVYYVDSQVMGTSNQRNSSVLNQTRFTVADFRRPPSVTIEGPSEVPPNYPCSWRATVSGGTHPYTYSWSGVASGSNAEVFASLSQSGWLEVEIEDQYGRGDGDGMFVTVSSSAPPCPF